MQYGSPQRLFHIGNKPFNTCLSKLLFLFCCQWQFTATIPEQEIKTSPWVLSISSINSEYRDNRAAPTFLSSRFLFVRRCDSHPANLLLSLPPRTPRSCHRLRPSARQRQTWRAASSASAAAQTWSTSTSCSWWRRTQTQPG